MVGIPVHKGEHSGLESTTVKIHRKVYQLLRVRSRIGVNLQYFINDATWNILVQFFFVLGRFPVRNP